MATEVVVALIGLDRMDRRTRTLNKKVEGRKTSLLGVGKDH